jgi:hypothetical protein
MLYWEIIAVFSQIHTKHINTVCGRNVEFLKVELVVHKVPYFPAYKTHRPIRRTMIFSLGILEKKMMNVFQF